jgi:riboflavin kinase/FMN adenylyltransferase
LTSLLSGEGRIYVCGEVERGDQRGRTLGFPTANLSIADECVSPPDGVYAGFAYTVKGEVVACAVSVGRRPTFYENRGLRLVEAHLLDFSGDLYGELLTVEIVARLRDQVRFDGVDELLAQLARDVELSRFVAERTAPSGRR